MKYILLIMTVLQIKSFWNIFKRIFTTKKHDHREVDDILLDVKLQNKFTDETVRGLLVILSLLSAIFFTVYYALIGIYLKGIFISILSCIFTVRTWQHAGKIAKWVGDTDDKSMFNKGMLTRLYFIAYLSYIGYFVYTLITTW